MKETNKIVFIGGGELCGVLGGKTEAEKGKFGVWEAGDGSSSGCVDKLTSGQRLEPLKQVREQAAWLCFWQKDISRQREQVPRLEGSGEAWQL